VPRPYSAGIPGNVKLSPCLPSSPDTPSFNIRFVRRLVYNLAFLYHRHWHIQRPVETAGALPSHFYRSLNTG
jgi:hypothetical protein